MEITNNTIINVCSYMPHTIIASTNVQDYIFEPCMTDTPVIIPMTAVEIKEIHSKSRVFADGLLSFEDDVKADVYKLLRVQDYENILNQVEIMNCIVSGKKDDIAKLISIKSKGYFERVYGVYVALKQSNMYDISMRVAKAIEHRHKELQQGVINTQIKILDNENNDNNNNNDDKAKIIEEQDKLIAQNQEKLEALESKFANLMELMERLTSATASAQQNNDDTDTKDSDVKPDTPRRGRKPATK